MALQNAFSALHMCRPATRPCPVYCAHSPPAGTLREGGCEYVSSGNSLRGKVVSHFYCGCVLLLWVELRVSNNYLDYGQHP